MIALAAFSSAVNVLSIFLKRSHLWNVKADGEGNGEEMEKPLDFAEVLERFGNGEVAFQRDCDGGVDGSGSSDGHQACAHRDVVVTCP